MKGIEEPLHALAVKKIRTVRDLKGRVYRVIKEGIITRKIPPGAQLREEDLGQSLGVSRTPVREALNQLSKDGIIEIIPRKGATVKKWARDEVIEILILREVLEGLAARLAAAHLSREAIARLEDYFMRYERGSISYASADENFHRDIIRASGSSRLHALITNLRDSLEMMNMRKVSFKHPERIQESLKEHRKIIRALRAGDQDLAERFTRDHFRRTRFYYESHMD